MNQTTHHHDWSEILAFGAVAAAAIVEFLIAAWLIYVGVRYALAG